MSTLTGPTFNLTLGNLVVVMVCASNEKGTGQYSGTNKVGALVQTVPLAPVNAPYSGPQTNQFFLDTNWQFLTTYAQRGGGYIDSYELDIDDGMGGNFVEVVGFTTYYTLNSILVTSGINSGFTYRLRYRAHNAQGWGQYSPIGQVLAATIPGATSAPTT